MGATIPKDRRTPPIVNENSVHESTFKAWVGGKRKSVNPSGGRLDREGSTGQLCVEWLDTRRAVFEAHEN